MPNTCSFTIQPHAPSTIELDQDEKPSLFSLALGVWFLLYMTGGMLLWIVAVITQKPEIQRLDATGEGLMASMIVAALLAPLLALLWRQWKIAEAIARKRARVAQDLSAEAAQLAQSTRAIHDVAIAIPAALRSLLQEADVALAEARDEYQDNAFAPFWDCVERVANGLGRFQAHTRNLAALSEQYRRALMDRKHTFPPFPVGLEQLPNPAPTLREFQAVVRLGQTNPSFAYIWEMRSIREVLIAGFRTLGEAVNNIGYSLSDSVSAVGGELTAGLRSLVIDSQEQGLAVEAHARREQELLRDIYNALQRRN